MEESTFDAVWRLSNAGRQMIYALNLNGRFKPMILLSESDLLTLKQHQYFSRACGPAVDASAGKEIFGHELVVANVSKPQLCFTPAEG